jgi:hypothetical protein
MGAATAQGEPTILHRQLLLVKVQFRAALSAERNHCNVLLWTGVRMSSQAGDAQSACTAHYVEGAVHRSAAHSVER